jgi:NAD(P)-dependent dehydrogenase (short-subunit alcohol dehydrogenase family)
MDQRLKNQVVWVSGAASGMGEAIARLFALEGAAVALIDIQAAKASAVAKCICDDGGRAVVIECDVAREDRVRSSIEHTVREFGGLTTIVNCAGIVQVKLLHELDVADWDRLMDINLKSIVLSIKHGLAHLKTNTRS